MLSSQKDRIIIIGGKGVKEESKAEGSEKSESEDIIDNEVKTVEEIDFLKRNIVSLASLRNARANSNAFMVNESIYVIGGC